MDAEAKFSPPYNIPWATFLSAVERIAADPPGRVDRSYLGSQSGNVQTYLIAALKGFGLIDDEARPTRILEFAWAESRKDKMADLLREFYPTVVPLGTSKTTPGQLQEALGAAFPNITGDSRTKAQRFLLAGMAYAELPVSALWSSVKAPRGASARSKPAKPRGQRAAASESQVSHQQGGTVDDMTRTYFNLLVEKAKAAEKLDTDLANRIERLIGVTPNGATKKPRRAGAAPNTNGEGETERVQTADSTPAQQEGDG